MLGGGGPLLRENVAETDPSLQKRQFTSKVTVFLPKFDNNLKISRKVFA